MGNVTKTTDSNNHTTQNVYNMLGQVTQKIDGVGKSEYYEYDNNGNVTKKTDRNGTVFTNTYDVRNRLITTYALNSTIGGGFKDWEYDKAGRVLKVTGTNLSRVLYAYDDAGRLSSVRRNGRTLEYEYDKNSNVTSVNDYFGNVTEYAYNTRGLTVRAGDTSLVYNKDGSIKEQNTGIYSQSYTYDDRSLLTGLEIRGENDILLYSEVNEYDTYGNRTQTDYVFGEVSGNTKNGRHTYEYDIFGQLENEVYIRNTYLGMTEMECVGNYRYDYAGNMTKDSDAVGEEIKNTIDANNRLVSTWCCEEEGEHTYDNNGNLKESTYCEDIVGRYAYNLWGNLISYTDLYENETSYTYYADGLRESKNGTVYYYNGDVVINESKGGELTAVNTIAGSRIVSRKQADGVDIVYGYNTHGDVALVLNASGGDPIQAYAYEAYGNIYDDMSKFYEKNYNGYDKNFDNPIRYAGQYWDSESGMYYMRASYYDPSMKRFTQEDPIRDGMNWYAYCEGNPVRYVDSSGLAFKLRGTGDEVQLLWQNLSIITDDDLVLTQDIDEDGDLLNTYTVSIGATNKGNYDSGTQLVRNIINSEKTAIAQLWDGGNNTHERLFGGDSLIKIDPNFSPNVKEINPMTEAVVSANRPLYIGFAHELIHANRNFNGTRIPYDWGDYTYKSQISITFKGLGQSVKKYFNINVYG